MKIHRKTSPKRPIKKDALRFSPNFSVYLLPDDIVCLYSEDRKYFLHGSLYCALASEIAKGKKSGRDLVVELGKSFPPDKIEEALKRLHERRHVVTGSNGFDGTVAGYWASLGLPPDEAEKNLRACRVRVEAIDVEGAKQLGAALADLGVRVVDRSADL